MVVDGQRADVVRGPKVSRRMVLRTGATGIGALTLGSLLVACGGGAETPAPAGSSGSSGAQPTTASSGGSSSSTTPASSNAASPAAGTSNAKPTGKATVAQGPEITDLDASMHTGMLTFNPSVHIMDPPLMRGPDLQPVPHLAEKYEFPNDTTLRLTVRKGVTFHDGSSLSVDDVLFTMNRVSNKDSKSDHRIYMARVTASKAVDDHTVELTLSEPDATLLGRLTLIPIVPQKVVEKMGDDAFNAAPVGSGPFKFVSWQKGQNVTLEAYEGYWRGPAKIKTLVFRGIKEDATRMAELQTGAIQVATNVPTQLVPQLKSAPNVDVMQVPSLRTLFIYLNTKEPPFDDLKMRQAVNYAIDKSLIVDGVLDGFGVAVDEPFGKEVYGFNPDVANYYTFDLDKAKQLVSDAGKSSGVEVNLFGPAGRLEKGEEVAQNVADQLKQIGIKVNLKFIEYQTYLENYSRKYNAEQQMGFWSNANNTADADYNLSLNIHSKGRLPYYSNPELDKKIDQARQLVDEKKREALYHEIVDAIVKDAPWLFLYTQVDLYGVDKKLKGWKPSSDEMIYLYDASVSG